MDLSGYTLATLHQDTEFVLYRARATASPTPSPASVLVSMPTSEHPPPDHVRMLEHELALGVELDSTWAVRPLALAQYQGRAALILEDTPGEPLERLLNQPMVSGALGPRRSGPMELGLFLRLAVGLAAALGEVHRRGLIHKDVKPAHVLVNVETGETWLTGFRIASRLPRERQAPAPPETIAGTLAYMAPEQTGRMNRSIDARSDLYALGATLYQMLTGSLPFTAVEPIEWVHCHIARQPLAPGDRVANVPAPVSAIVMKLLAKTGEERYQTAAGLERDLLRCRAQWEADRRVDYFPIGEHDAPDRLLIPEKLYGRRREVETLLAAFDRVVNGGAPELVVVSGYSGIGKSSVVHELQPVLVPPRALFAAGKFDQYKRDIPYSTLAQAFQSLVRPLLARSDIELGDWREVLREALGPNGQLMVDLVPELRLIIGNQAPVPELPPQHAQRRFQLVFRRFLAVFAQPEHPLALFLDDLQWLDAATLDLLEDLLIHPDVRHVLLIGAYRDNEVTAAHPLMRTLDRIRRAGAPVREIVLAPLAREHVGALVTESLHCEREHAAPLSELVQQKTAGNPFFVIQFLSALVEHGLLAFDHGAAHWVWDLARIHGQGYTDNVVDLMVGKLSRLPIRTQRFLQLLACLGNSADFSQLAMVSEDTEEDLRTDLRDALRSELVVHSERLYRFLHDRVQEAAYSLIPEDQRAEAHLRIGRLLATHTPAERREEAIFEIVNQLNRGARLITSGEERGQLAELNLTAGMRAKSSSAYASALTYLAAGAAMLPEDAWVRRQELAFELELHPADCEVCMGALEAAEERLAALATRAAGTVQRCAVARRRVELYTILGAGERAVEVALECLGHVGIAWSAHPGDGETRDEYERIWSLLGMRAIEDLVDLPPLQDPEVLATLDILAKMSLPAEYVDENLVELSILRATSLSLERGNSDLAPVSYAAMGMIASARFGQHERGYRLGKLACDLVERRGWSHFAGRVYNRFAVVVPWTRPLVEAIDPARRGFQLAARHGEPAFASYACRNLLSVLLALGHSLDQVEDEAEQGLAFVLPFGSYLDRMSAPLALVRTLRGKTATFGSLDDGRFTEHAFEERATGEPTRTFLECYYWLRKLQARFFAGDYVSALAAVDKVDRWYATSPPLSLLVVEKSEYQFYAALSRAASCAPTGADQYDRHREALHTHDRELRGLAASCPDNFASRAALVGAEIARLEGRELDAERMYEAAIKSARASEFVHDEALANELAARFYTARGFHTIAHAYLRDARYAYLRWGADGKVRQLDQLYPHLTTEQAAAVPTGTIGAPLEQLDLATVIKVSQAVSGEVILDKLLDTLLRTAIEHAGAERAVLILAREGELRIAAEAATDIDAVVVSLLDQPVTASTLPETILRYVLHTHESVILDDAAVQNPFLTDPYLGERRARSVLCLPLTTQAKLNGVLYLENHLAPDVFAPARIAVLKLLASQAATSLENARLYRDLGERERESRLMVASIPGSVATLTPAGEVETVSEHFIAYCGRTLEEVKQWAASDIIHPDDLPRAIEIISGSMRSGDSFEIVQRLRRFDGIYRWFQARGLALRGSAGSIVRWYVLLTDIDDLKRAEDALRASEEQLRLTLDSIGGLVTTFAPSGELEFANRPFRDYTGRTLEELRTARDILHPADRAVIDQWHRSLETGQPLYGEARFRRNDGAFRWFYLTALPVRDSSGQIARWYGLITDIEERKQAEEKLRRSEADLLEAQRLTHIGSWKLDVSSGRVAVSPEIHRIFATESGDPVMTSEFWFQRIHPEDRPRVQDLFARCLAERTNYQAAYRIVLPDGTIKHQESIGYPIVNQAGQLVEFAGTALDVTEQVRSKAELQTAFEEIKRLKDELYRENLALREEVDRVSMFEEIVGNSRPLQAVLSRVVKVAATDSSVLITGETGTGKELVARAIHRRSARASRAFVSVNCAAVPRELIASELFGHEKGAFTGATQRRLGRFELAHGGTIFLDEVGELPMETQVALLRVLQEREFARIGGTAPVRVDVRVVAATNRDLPAAIEAGTFRSDLFYRLNVFPIAVPALRERADDIPLLVEYFIDRYARKAGKTIRRVQKRTLDHLRAYPWPGNVRELQNVIERSVIVCDTHEFIVDESWLSARPTIEGTLALSGSLAAHEKTIIEDALRASGGRVFGPSGAAARLGIPRSTLESKIRALRINKNRFRARPA